MERLHVIACPSLRPELEMLASEARAVVAFQYLEMALHERSASALHEALQEAIDGAPAADAIAVAYGLCNRGVIGIAARAVPVVVPRAHDCIGILLGSGRYLAELAAQPGTYFESAGWMANARVDVRQPVFTFGPASNVTRARLAEKYGEEEADYLIEQFEGFTRHYDRLAYIATPAPGSREGEAAARRMAAKRNWEFARLESDAGWLRRLVNGEWDAGEFLTLQPGERVAARSDELLIGAEPA